VEVAGRRRRGGRGERGADEPVARGGRELGSGELTKRRHGAHGNTDRQGARS
jgi:hypothetical protein